jgi:prepilin-type N-terminal cleavage/methylation domain-containing protein
MDTHSLGPNRRGFTLIEMLIVVALVSVLSAFSLPYLRDGQAKSGVRGATSAIASYHAIARNAAISRGRTAVLVVKAAAPASMLVVLRRSGTNVVDTVGTVENLFDRFAVTLTTSGDSLVFSPRGIGYGTSTITIIAARGGVADTLAVSGAGRLIR